MNILFSLLPAAFREMLPYLSPRAFTVVDLKQVAQVTLSSGKQWLSKSHYVKGFRRIRSAHAAYDSPGERERSSDSDPSGSTYRQ